MAAGLLTLGVGNYWLSRMNLQISPWQVVWPRVVIIAGLSMIFAPLNVAAFMHIPKELRGAAVGLLALLRNEGGSVGTSVAQTILERREQFHTLRVNENLDPLNPAVRDMFRQGNAFFLQHTGDAPTSRLMTLQALSNLCATGAVAGLLRCLFRVRGGGGIARFPGASDEAGGASKGRTHRRRITVHTPLDSFASLVRIAAMRIFIFALAVALTGAVHAEDMKSIRLDTLDLRQVAQGWGLPQKDRSVDKHPLSIGGRKFDHGFGTHADSKLTLDFDGGAGTFSAFVGVDDEVKEKGTVRFSIVGDKKTLWESGVMKGGDAAKEVKVALDGIKRLSLVVDDAGDGSDSDHADWADAVFMVAGSEPTIHRTESKPVVLTPPATDAPRINGAKIFGVRPGNPFLYTIAATGARPMEFSADNLPEGLSLDSKTGQITGKIAKAGEYLVMLHAKNKDGAFDREAQRGLKIVCGSTIALTPPMGWNSWNCWAGSVSDDKVRAAADAMVKSGLVNHGWTYINIDDYWEFKPSAKDDPTLQGDARDKDGFINPNKRFPDMKALTDYVHSKGLKIGLYSSPGPLTCGRCIASYQHEDQDAQQLGRVGFRLHQVRLVHIWPDRTQKSKPR